MTQALSPEQLAHINGKAYQIRRDIIEMLTEAGSGHPGGSLSAADIVATLYFGGLMVHDPAQPQLPGRDRFILSKGHAAPVLYAALAEDGYFERSELKTLRKLGSRLQGHPDCLKLPGVEVSTGSLGQGLSIACGLALGLLRDAGASASPAPTVFTLLGDGETQEGQVWEAAQFAPHYKLTNLVAIIDHNHLQIDGAVEDVMDPRDLAAKFQDFGWKAYQVDGHDVGQLHQVLADAKEQDGAPAAIIAETVKGKGVPFMEGQAGWHGKAPNAEQCAEALAALDDAAEKGGLR